MPQKHPIIDEKGLEAAEAAWRASVEPTCKLMLRTAIRAYLAASPSPSEMDVVANLRSDAAQLLRMSKATAFGEDLSVRVTKPDLLIANMIAAADAIGSLSAQVLRLTEENEALRDERRWPPDAEFQYGDWVEKFTGEARWEGRIVSAYHTKRLALRYVVEVEPQGFQMIAFPAQLRAITTLQKEQADG